MYIPFSSYFCQFIFCAIKNKENFKQNKNDIFSSHSSYQVIFKLDSLLYKNHRQLRQKCLEEKCKI